MNRVFSLIFCSGIALVFQAASAQQRSISIKEALLLVQSQQPQLTAYKERASAARYDINLAKNTLMPQLEAGYQAGYATYNNITGMSYPGLIMPISGPPSLSNTYDPVPGTAVAALLKWSPLTFGQRQVAVEKAAAQYKLAASQYDDALFREQYTAINVYLEAVYLRKLLTTIQANIERTDAGLQQSLVLAREGLRPGIDTAQFQSALAQAEMDRLNTQRLYQSQLSELTRLTGLTELPDQIQLTDTMLTVQAPVQVSKGGTYTANPLYRYYQAKKALSESALKEVERSWRPRLDIWANAYSRGSGIQADGTVHKADGWSLTRNNYGAGLQLSFPVLQFSQVSIRRKQYRSLVKADDAQLSQVTLNLQKQSETAQYNYRQNQLVAQQAPVQSKAARYAYEGLKLSYQSGLTDYTRLTQGQYDLLKAEIAEAGAYLQVWRSLLEIAVAGGDLQIFTDQLK
jgi:outer membrane protein TolC